MTRPSLPIGLILFAITTWGPLTSRPAWAAEADPRPIALPALESWDRESVDVRKVDAAAELTVPRNYVVGRAVSPSVPARDGELFTLAADVTTRFGFKASPELYRCWLEIEFLAGKKVVGTVASPELTGTREAEQPLAVTAAAPAGATAARAVLCAQNKLWAIVDNAAAVRNVRLLRLDGRPGGEPTAEAGDGLKDTAGERAATVVVRGDWPDGAAVAVSSTRGTVPPAVLLSGGRAEVPLRYAAADVGAAVVTARIAGRETTVRVADPRAATLTIESVTADGRPTPALVQLTRDGVMLPGRYQLTVPGIYVTPPWSVDLAPGRWRLRVCRGPRFEAVERTIEAKSGETVVAERIELKPVADLPAEGWYGGDADGDVYHGELVYTDIDARTAADISRAMGLDWVGVGRWGVSGHGTPDPKTWNEARAVMRDLSGPDLLFLWTDEKPKSREGHACFVGLTRPDAEKFGWRWTGTAGRPLRNFECLGVVRASGGATFANHPLRWWVSGTKFTTNMACSLPFDLCAAGRLDGVNVNDKPDNLRLWSMLLDHGYQVAATAGADFGLDRPGGPPPGLNRMYALCPDGLSGPALAEAVRRGNTVASTGPTLLADAAGLPPGSMLAAGKAHPIRVRAWARGDRPDELTRIELWSHGKPVAEKKIAPGTRATEAAFEWTPEGERDWVAVRAVSKGGWALTSAFYAGDGWVPRGPVPCELTVDVTGLPAADYAKTTVEVWDGPPGLVTSKMITGKAPLDAKNATLAVPVTATVVVTAPGGKREVSVYDATGVHEVVERIASGAERERPLLDWATYEEVLGRCRTATAKVAF